MKVAPLPGGLWQSTLPPWDSTIVVHNGEAKTRVLGLGGGAGFVRAVEAVEDVR